MSEGPCRSAVLAWTLCGLLAGVALQLQQEALWSRAAYAELLLAALAGAVMTWRHAGGRLRPVLLAIAFAAMGLGATGWQAHGRLAERLAPELEGRDLVVTGIVAGLPDRGAAGVRFRFDIEQASDGSTALTPGEPGERGALQLPERVMLSWYAEPNQGGPSAGQAQEIRAGERWSLPVRLRQPHGNFNPGGFDHELWLFERGIGATGFVRSKPGGAARLLDARAGRPVERWRQQVRDAIEAAVPDPRNAGVLAALVVGDQAAIERRDWDLFRITGVAHLMSISGLHVTMFGWIAAAALGRLWCLSPALMLWAPAPAAARWGGLAAATAYALFSGWGVPAQRTVWMLASVTLLASAGKRWPWPMILLAAAAVVATLDPWALLQPGFWLSFMAVGILIASERRSRGSDDPGPMASARHLLGSAFRTQLVATVGLAPLTLLFFQQVSLVGLAANLLAIPFVTLVVTPLAMLGIAAPPLWQAAAWSVQGLVAALEILSGWPWAQWLTPAAPAWAMAAGLAGGVLAVLPLPWRVRALAVPLLLPLLWPPVSRPVPGSFELLAADVGQGTAVVVRTSQHTLVYDTGPRYSLESDAGSRVMVPLLRSLGVDRIDLLMLSHGDTDHVGGAEALLAAYPGTPMSSSLAPAHPLVGASGGHRECRAGQRWAWDDVSFEVLHPGADERAPPLRTNQVSCVLKVSSASGHRILLAGDIERGEEARLVEAWGHRPEALAADLLLVPHHGSKTSSTRAFLAAVSPRVAVFQHGRRNRFGHPAPEVWARYAERGIVRISSPSCGAYRWEAGVGRCERDLRRRYWHHVE